MKLPESMPDLLERATKPVADGLSGVPWYRKMPLKLQIGLPMGALFGAYAGYRYGGLSGDPVALVIAGVTMLAVWALAIGVTVFDHFETKKRRASKRGPVDFG